MSGTNPVFLVRKAKKSSGQKDAVLWCSDDFEAANATLDYLLIKSGAKLKDYFKAVATNFPVVNDLPPEGELSLTFCDFYQLGRDNMTWAQIPGVTLPSSEAVAAASQRIVDGVDTETGEVLEDHTETFGNEEGVKTSGSSPELTVVATMPFRHRVLAQLIGEGEYLYHVDTEQKKAIRELEMDTDNSYVQNLLLAAENVQEFKKAIEHDIHKAVKAVVTVFPIDGRIPELALLIRFLKTWFDTEYIDRGLLVKEWAKGNRVSQIQRTTSGTNAGGGIKTDRHPELNHDLNSLDIEIALATLPMDFNIYECPGSVYRRAKEIFQKKESPFKEWSVALRETPGILDYSRAAIFALIRGAGENVHHFPVSLRRYINANLTESNHEKPTAETLSAARHVPEKDAVEEIDRLDAERGEFVEGISEPTETSAQPQVGNLGGGIFSIEGLMGETASNEGEKTEVEATSDVQVQETDGDEEQDTDALQTDESDAGTVEETVSVESAADILAAGAPSLANPEQDDVNQNSDSVSQNIDSVSHSEPEVQQTEPEAQQDEPDPEQAWPEYFEPGRYEAVPNDVYHAANGISSTMVKDARVSLMYYDGRHVSKTIKKERSKVLDMGNLVHALALQPEILDEEFSIEPVIPEGVLTTTATIRAVIDDYNNSLPALLSADDIKRFIEEYNATLPAQVPLGASLEETGHSYMELPEEFQRIDDGQKQTAAAMKACIKEYNATLPAQVKTSGSRDALLDQLAIINPDLVAQEAQKPQPLKVSGTKADLIQAVKAVKPELVFADELLDAWRENPGDKILVTRQQYATALAIQSALYAHPEAGKLLQNPTRAVEVSYFGIDDDTGLEIRVRPDVELEYEGLRIGFDLKTISMWDVKEDSLKSRLHREITMRDYHLSAGMYCNVADLDKFAWIFVNKDEGYHWVAVVWASESLLELGKLEYRQTIRAIANAMDTGEWPAPITEDYTDELNDYDLRRLDVLREMA